MSSGEDQIRQVHGEGFESLEVDEETRQLQAELAKAEALHAQAIKGGSRQGPARSIEGWVIIACGIHEEAQEDDVYEAINLIHSFRV